MCRKLGQEGKSSLCEGSLEVVWGGSADRVATKARADAVEFHSSENIVAFEFCGLAINPGRLLHRWRGPLWRITIARPTNPISRRNRSPVLNGLGSEEPRRLLPQSCWDCEGQESLGILGHQRRAVEPLCRDYYGDALPLCLPGGPPRANRQRGGNHFSDNSWPVGPRLRHAFRSHLRKIRPMGGPPPSPFRPPLEFPPLMTTATMRAFQAEAITTSVSWTKVILGPAPQQPPTMGSPPHPATNWVTSKPGGRCHRADSRRLVASARSPAQGHFACRLGEMTIDQIMANRFPASGAARDGFRLPQPWNTGSFRPSKHSCSVQGRL